MFVIRKLSSVTGLMAATVLMLGIVTTPTASARQRYEYQNAAGVCQGALPSYETSLRYSPLAVSNEGSSTVFVSCSILSENLGNNPPQSVGMIFHNNNSVAGSLSCSFVLGTRALGLNYYTVTNTVGQNSQNGVNITPDSVNNGNPLGKIHNLSCALPAGMALKFITRVYFDGSAAG